MAENDMEDCLRPPWHKNSSTTGCLPITPVACGPPVVTVAENTLDLLG
jgi:hypothetical protein